MELAQLLLQFFFFAARVLVAQGMELRGMIHVGEVCQFVADDVAYQFLGKKHEVARQLNNLLCCAVAQFAHPPPYLKACGT